MEPVYGLGFALVSALLFGGYLVFIKEYLTKYTPSVYLAGVNGFALLWYLPIGFLTVDGNLIPGGLGMDSWVMMIGVALLTALALLTLFRALIEGEVSYVAPISKLVPLFV